MEGGLNSIPLNCFSGYSNYFTFSFLILGEEYDMNGRNEGMGKRRYEGSQRGNLAGKTLATWAGEVKVSVCLENLLGWRLGQYLSGD